MKSPPAYSVPPDKARAWTVLFMLGSKPANTAPVVASTAAKRFRGVPPLTVVNKPPAYSVPPDRARAKTELFMLGSKPANTAPVVASTAAKRFRGVPPLTVVK
jgi:hypothetical protein